MIAYWIAFGPHGPRAQAPKGEGWKITFKVLQLTGVSVALFYLVHAFAGKQPKTMSKEWQEASNEYAKVSISQYAVLFFGSGGTSGTPVPFRYPFAIEYLHV